MQLADYQQELVDFIYDWLINEDENNGVNIYGSIGSGKSTIALGVVEQLLEGWSVFYLEGINPTISPYLTWHIGTKLYSKKKLSLGGEISFGVDFLPSPFSIEFGTSLQVENSNYVLSPNEEVLLKGIIKECQHHTNILFVIDNYELWDLPSKQFLQKLLCKKLNLLSDHCISVILISQTKEYMDIGAKWEYISTSKMSDNDILFVLRQNGFSKTININDIRACAGDDLSLALMAAQYYSNNNSLPQSFGDIMNKRRSQFSAYEQKAYKEIQPLSIIDAFFTKDELAFFIDPISQNVDEATYLADEYIAFAEEQFLIVGVENYRFTNEKVKEYFKGQLSKREKYYHKKFADYLQSKHPEDYYSRGKHTMYSLSSNDPLRIIEAWQLLLIAYFRRANETGNLKDMYNIFEDIHSLLNRLNSNLKYIQEQTMWDFVEGFKAFIHYDYSVCIECLQTITPSRLASPALAEILRLILLSQIQLAINKTHMQETADELFELINASDFIEDEEYCRAALVLIDVYIDRIKEDNKAKILKTRMVRKIQIHQYSAAFQEFEACYNRKAALYFAAPIAFQQTAQSVFFYQKHMNRNGLYMSLCNHSGNAIISGDYHAAQQALDQCDKLLINSNGWSYQSYYKIENNKLLLAYLLKEVQANNDKELLFSAAVEARDAFAHIKIAQKDEVSYVVLLNYISLSLLSGEKECLRILNELSMQIDEFDEYYQYYIRDLNFASAILQGNKAIAESELSLLETIQVPLLRSYHTIFQKRRLAQRQLINDIQTIKGDALIYQKILSRACTHIQDSSCHFYGRGFLLSDLQFLAL